MAALARFSGSVSEGQLQVLLALATLGLAAAALVIRFMDKDFEESMVFLARQLEGLMKRGD